MTSGTTTALDPLALFGAAAEHFATGIAAADLDAPVPACPRWTVLDLVVHLGNVHAWAATIVETGRFAVTHNDEPSSRRPRVVGDWYAGKAGDLYEALRSTDPTRPCWNFVSGDGQAGFWRRRQLHETTVHGIDLDLASGRRPQVTADVATDGVDEVLTVMLERMHEKGFPAALTAPLALVCEDTGRAWTLRPRPWREEPPVPSRQRGPAAARPRVGTSPGDGPPLVDEHREPQADQVAGPAGLLYQALWKRAPYDALTRTGDAARIAAFLDSRLVP